MFTIGKGPLATYIGSGCKRRLRLDSYRNETVRTKYAVSKDIRRPGGDYIRNQGREHEYNRFEELINTFDEFVIKQEPTISDTGERALGKTSLSEVINQIENGNFVIEAEYDPPEIFLEIHGINKIQQDVRMSKSRPDILYVTSDIAGKSIVSANGKMSKVQSGDNRLGLVNIDVKLAAEAGPKHFAELAFYNMTLACWIDANNLQDRFVVLSDAAIWAGPAGSLKKKLTALKSVNSVEKYRIFLDDLTVMPSESVMGRVIQALQDDLVETLSEPDWKSFKPHVDIKCSGCDYLGYDFFPPLHGTEDDPDYPPSSEKTKNKNYCLPATVQEDDLSRIAGMSEGAAGVLTKSGIKRVSDLANIYPDHEVFDQHQILNINRHAFIARAKALTDLRSIGVHDEAGSTTSLPKFSDIRVALSVESDPASGKAFAFGYQIVAAIPNSEQHNNELITSGRRVEKRDYVALVLDTANEGNIYTEFLNKLKKDILEMNTLVNDGYSHNSFSQRHATIQFYVWDGKTTEKFKALSGEHLIKIGKEPSKDEDIPLTAWLFPPDHVVPGTSNLSQSVTTVKDTLRLVALALPHNYGQLEVANLYRHLKHSTDCGKPI